MRRSSLRSSFVLALFLAALAPVFAAAAQPSAVRASAPQAIEAASPFPTMLDQSGHLDASVTAAQIAAWRRTIHESKAAPNDLARADIDLGEYLLAQEKQPDEAIDRFDAAASLAGIDRRARGLAAYDKALALYNEGAYREADDAFLALDTPATALPGYDRRSCALWLRHSAACAGYHSQRAELGIPEPPRLDPYCGAAALATYLKANGLPYDKQTVVSHCHITGEGNDLADLIAAGRQLGVSIHEVQANDRGLMELPKPVLAHVEGDHFISVVEANKSNVIYLCSDCGPWPGGRVDLTWSQWHALDADVYGVMVRPGSDWDRALASIESKTPAAKVQVAAAGNMMRIIPAAMAIANMIRGSVVATSTGSANCNRVLSPECPPDGTIICSCPAPGSGGGGSGGDGIGGGGSGISAYGASAGDPVNLATGDEDYDPAPDMVVYNPDGPSVTWQRLYTSLSSPSETTIDYDFGASWNQQYGYQIAGSEDPRDPEIWDEQFQYPNGAEITFDEVTAPTSSDPTTTLPVPAGYPFLLQWDYVSSSSYGQFVMTMKDHTVWILGEVGGAPPGGSEYRVTNIANPNGGASTSNSIDFTYDDSYLESIKDHASGTTLLTINRNSSDHITSVADDNGRSVYYTDTDTEEGEAGAEVATVSEIVPTGTSSPPSRYTYGYTEHFGPAPDYDADTLDEGPWFLNEITVPSPTGSGTATANLYYNSYDFVGKKVDANSNATIYTSTNALGVATTPSNYTEVTYQNDDDNTVYTRIAGYNANMSASSGFDFGNGTTGDTTAFSSSDPYRPATTYDGDALYSVTPGSSVSLPAYGSDAPGSGHSWEIYNKAGTLVDYSATNGDTGSNGWKVTGSGSTITVVAPSGSSNIAAHYEARSNSSSPTSAYFDVYATAKGATTYTWDAYANLDTITDPRGMETTNTYSTTNFALGDLTEVQETNGSAYKSPTTYSYMDGDTYKNGLITQMNTPVPGTVDSSSSEETTFTYDESTYAGSETTLNLLTTEVDPGNSTYSTITSHWNYVLDSDYSVGGHPVGGSYVEYSLTSGQVGEPLVYINGDCKETHYRYDAFGNTTMVIDALGNETDYTYNLANQMTSETQYTPYSATPSHSAISAIVYNYLYTGGPLTSVQTENGSGTVVREVGYTYGPEGELLSESADDIAGDTGWHAVASYTYDPLYRVKTITDGNGNMTTYTYSPTTGDLSLVQYPGAGTDTTGSDTVNYSAYDPDANLLTRIDGNSAETDYSYDDPDSQLTKVAYPSGTIANVTHAYDAYGRMSGMTDGVFLAVDGNPGEAFTYDDLDNVTSKTVNYSTSVTALEGLEISYGYNNDGTRASMTVPTYSSGGNVAGTFDYSYDDVGRMVGLTNPSDGTFSWSYDDNSWLASQLSQDAADNTMVDSTYTYDARGELTDLRNYEAGGSTMWSEFGGDGIGSDPVPMTYDPNYNRLTMQATESYATYSGTVDYGYDYKNELTSEASTRNGGSGSPIDNTYDYSGNFTELRGASVPTANSDNQLTATGYSFDGNGNPTTYAGNTLTFDPENRMTSYTASGTSEMQAGYGFDGLRAWRTDSSGNTVYYLYDDSTPVIELSSSGVVNVVNSFGVNGLLGRYSENFSGGSYERFYAFDPQGNCAEMIAGAGSSGTLLLSATYDGFGMQSAYPTTYDTDAYDAFGAQGRYFLDAGTGLELLGHRYYDEANGRFLNRDPIGFWGGIDLYAYVQDNPVRLIDPSGKSCAGALVGLAGATVLVGLTCAFGGPFDPVCDAAIVVWLAALNDVRHQCSWAWACLSTTSTPTPRIPNRSLELPYSFPIPSIPLPTP